MEARTDPTMFLWAPNRAFAEIVYRAVPPGQEVSFQEVYLQVLRDYGKVAYETVVRMLARMTKHGVIVRSGAPKHFVYSRPRK